jgi:integrase
MVKPVKRGRNSWSVRVRIQGQDVFLSGYPTAEAAKRAAHEHITAIQKSGAPAKFGPQRTSVAAAFLDYAREKLPRLKGAPQDARRINRYLVAAGLPRIVVSEPAQPTDAQRWLVSFDETNEIVIPNSLKAHRARQAQASARSDAVRRKLACKTFAKVTRADIQDLTNALGQDGKGVDDVRLEIAELSRLFGYAKKCWNWAEPGTNPASDIDRAKTDTARNRVLSQSEWNAMLRELAAYDNAHALPAFALLLESAMRSSEPLLHAVWGNLDWHRCVLHLKDSKVGPRDVPLSPGAMQILRTLYERDGKPGADQRLLPTTYEALKRAWAKAREAAGIKDVHGHDLRHTAATRYALELDGNVPVLKLITGHKTDSQLMRYVNLRVDDAVTKLHGRPMDPEAMPARYVATEAPSDTSSQHATAAVAKASNVISVNFGRRAA